MVIPSQGPGSLETLAASPLVDESFIMDLARSLGVSVIVATTKNKWFAGALLVENGPEQMQRIWDAARKFLNVQRENAKQLTYA